MLLLDDDVLYEWCMFLRDHGRVKGIPYDNSEVTYKYMPSTPGLARPCSFQRIDELVGRKRELLRMYRDGLAI